VAEVVERAARLGCSDLFVQVRGRGDAYYPTRLSPAAEDLAPEFDALATALALAHARGLRVHAWLNVLLAWSAPEPPVTSNHVVNRHPDWFVTLATPRGRRPSLELSRRELDRLGVVGHFLTPDKPEVVAHLTAVVGEVAELYPVDGIHLDYVRYPDYQVEGEARAVSELVARLADAARAARPAVIVSAAVYPDPAIALERKGQAWDAWLAAGDIDLAVPMCYGEQRDDMLREMRMARGVDGALWAGVAFYNKPLDVAVQGIDSAWDLGFGGVALFSHESVRELGPAGEMRLTDVLHGRKGREEPANVSIDR
jgi:uncharacterized lipoprotein YddW (UPF0748 family)